MANQQQVIFIERPDRPAAIREYQYPPAPHMPPTAEDIVASDRYLQCVKEVYGMWTCLRCGIYP